MMQPSLARSVPVQDADPSSCPLCSAAADPAFTAYDRNRGVSAQPFRYRTCRACGVCSLVDIPSDLQPFYPTDYYGLLDADALEGIAWVEEHKVQTVKRHVASGRLVEIGPGPGVFAYAARRAGFDVTVVEMDERTATHLRDGLGFETVTSADPSAALTAMAPADAIVMWHVIEHLPDPWDVLAAVSQRLRPGGAFVVAAPNPSSLQFRVLRRRWAHVDAPRHLCLLPFSTLVERCAALGMRSAGVTTSDPAGRHWNRFGWEYAMRRDPSQGPPSRLTRAASLALTLALRPVEHRGLNGAAYTATFIKD